jgi:CRISPR-associated endonuclease Cas3-HD
LNISTEGKRSPEYFAHSANAAGSWHTLRDHLASVSRLARAFMQEHPAADEAAIAGLLHDLGKYGDRFQKRLRGEDRGLDHWSRSAQVVIECGAMRDFCQAMNIA